MRVTHATIVGITLAALSTVLARGADLTAVGEFNAIVLRADFSDYPGESVSTQNADAVMTQVSQFYRDSSYGAMTWKWTVSPTLYRAPRSAQEYATGSWGSLLTDIKALAANDYTFTPRTVVIVAARNLSSLPNSIVPSDGVGSADGTLILGTFYQGVVVHEIGHWLGLAHANSWRVNDGNPVSDGGSSREYGDEWDPMGTGYTGDFNPYYKRRLGWLPDAAVQVVRSSGVYRLYRFDHPQANTSRTLALTLFREGQHTYWIGFRGKASGVGAYVLWADSFPKTSQILLNHLTMLGVGESLADPRYGITITTMAHGGSGVDEYLDIEVKLPASSPNAIGVMGENLSGTSIPVGLAGVVRVAGGQGHTLALKSDGTIVAWGNNGFGQCTIPAAAQPAVSIAAGGFGSGAIVQGGGVVLWGAVGSGATAVPPGLTAVELAIGAEHVLALRPDGTVVAWGGNSSGQTNVPAGLAHVVHIAAGRDYSLALQADGTVVSWGAQRGRPPATVRNVTCISANTGANSPDSLSLAAAVTSTGNVIVWGADVVPTIPSNLGPVVSVAVAEQHVVCLLPGGRVSVFGADPFGLGVLDVPDALPPAVGVAASAGGSYAVLGDPPSSRLSNLSVRAQLAANQSLIVGFVQQGGAGRVLARGIGPTLGAYGVAEPMADPALEVRDGGGSVIVSNDDWPVQLAPTFASVGAFPLTVASKDAAIAVDVVGSETVRAFGRSAGILLVEVYDLSTLPSAQLVNVSARGQVGIGANVLIAGFTIAGTGARQVLVRAAGPALTPLGVTGALADPWLEIHDAAGAIVAENNDWDPALTGTASAVGAFAFPDRSKDAAVLRWLAPGAYTAVVRGAGTAAGEALVEVYLVK